MNCNGMCKFCVNQCSRETVFKLPEDESKKALKIVKTAKTEETGLAVIEPVEFEVVKNLFGKEKVRRVK